VATGKLHDIGSPIDGPLDYGRRHPNGLTWHVAQAATRQGPCSQLIKAIVALINPRLTVLSPIAPMHRAQASLRV